MDTCHQRFLHTARLFMLWTLSVLNDHLSARIGLYTCTTFIAFFYNVGEIILFFYRLLVTVVTYEFVQRLYTRVYCFIKYLQILKILSGPVPIECQWKKI